MDSRQVGLKYGFRSGLEERTGEHLASLGVPFAFEDMVLQYTVPARQARYTPDFQIAHATDPTRVLVVETKGRWLTADRQKMRLIKTEFPELDIRMVFSNPNQRISKQSKTTYGMVCDKIGIPYAAKVIPDEWLREYGHL